MKRGNTAWGPYLKGVFEKVLKCHGAVVVAPCGGDACDNLSAIKHAAWETQLRLEVGAGMGVDAKCVGGGVVGTSWNQHAS